MSARALVLVVATGTLACSEPLEFADWTVPVPPGTPIIEYAAVPMEERAGRLIEVEEDLVIGREDDTDYRFYRALGVAAAGDGTIYVFDAGNYRIQAYDAFGRFLRSIGRRGGGPGEMSFPSGQFALSQRTLYHFRRPLVTTWDRRSGVAGHKGEIGTSSIVWDFGVTSADEMFAIHSRRDGTGEEPLRAVARVGSDEYRLISSLPSSRPLMLTRRSGSRVNGTNTRIPIPESDLAVDPSGGVYFSAGAEYQVVRASADGSWDWALRVAWPRLPVTEELIQASLDLLRESVDGAVRSEVGWVDQLPALSVASKSVHSWDMRHPLRLDGDGNLYVFPFVADDIVLGPIDRDPGLLRPVDVYSPQGELLFAGMMPEISWADAEDDFVYGLKFDRAVEEQRAVRYRLRRPWKENEEPEPEA